MMEVLNPTGARKLSLPFAARLDSLRGKKIGLLNNGQWQVRRTMPIIQELLQKEFPTATFVSFGDSHLIQQDEMIDLIQEQGCEGVIVGHAA